jgi:hypothetical protein
MAHERAARDLALRIMQASSLNAQEGAPAQASAAGSLLRGGLFLVLFRLQVLLVVLLRIVALAHWSILPRMAGSA